MSKKVLYTANTYNHLYLCHRPYFKWFKNNNFIVHTATNSNKIIDNVDKSFYIPIERFPLKFSNLKAIFQLKKIIEKERYDLIHTNTPMGAVVTRLAAIKYRKNNNIKVIYTAHGFHFFKKCSFINYIFFYPVEKILSKYTDLIITINKEDYEFAKKHFKTNIEYIPGIGFEKEKLEKNLTEKEKERFRKENELELGDYVISYIAEISNRKRQLYLLKVLKKMKLTNEKVLLIGDSSKSKKLCKKILKYNLQKNVKVLGFKNNVSNYLDISDLIISVSKQEGLPLNIMEAMYKNKPIIVTNCRGNRDLIKNNKNGIVVELKDKLGLASSIALLKENPKYAEKLSSKNKNIVEKYSIDCVLPIMEKIYIKILKGYYDNKKRKIKKNI